MRENAQLFPDTSLKNFRSALKESTGGMRFKTKVHLEGPSAVRIWRPTGKQGSTDELFERDLFVQTVVQPKRLYFMSDMWGIVWEVLDALAYPPEHKCPFDLEQ